MHQSLSKSLQKTGKWEAPGSHFHSASAPCSSRYPELVFFWLRTGDAQQISLSFPACRSWVAAPWLVGGLSESSPRSAEVSRAARSCQFSRRAAEARRADHTGCCKHCHSKCRHSCNTLDSHAWGAAGVSSQSLLILRPYLSKNSYIEKYTLAHIAMLQSNTLKTCSVRDLLRSRVKFQAF